MRIPVKLTIVLSCAVSALIVCGAETLAHQSEVALPSAVQKLQAEAEALQPLVDSTVAKEFLDATSSLPTVSPRTIYRDKETGRWMSSREAEALPEEKRQALQEQPITDSTYYNTRYGTPLAYSRVLELLGEQGVATLNGKKVLDFGYGTVGHLRLMAACGAHVVGLDVDSFLTALYSEPQDQGVVVRGEGASGRVDMVSGLLSQSETRDAIGSGYDIITSKNTLKRGYVNPPADAEVNPRMLIDLGLEDEVFMKAMFEMLNPGGILVIYNLSPKAAGPGEKFIPMADGRCPFDREMLEKVGFQIVQYDRNDDEAARAMAHALGWQEIMDVDNNLFAQYTVLIKPK